MRELVREAASAHGGAEVDWAGDGVFLAFSRAHDAVSAAAARSSASLAAEPWPDDEPHRLRIGIHTGEPELGDEGYVGIGRRDRVADLRRVATASRSSCRARRVTWRATSPFRVRPFARSAGTG